MGIPGEQDSAHAPVVQTSALPAPRTEPSTLPVVRARVSIFIKLLILIVSLVVATTLALASYLLSRQMHEMQLQLEAKAATYGRFASKQVESAIAFGDRETAREVFDSLAEDRTVESLTLFTANGAVLHARGALSSHLPVDVRQVTRPTAFAVADRVGVAVPVVSLEGPRGTLAIELSTRRLAASRAVVLKQAVLACVLAGLAGSLGAFLIARSLARRVQAIAKVANAVAAGDLSQRPVPEDGSRDEIGVTASAFNAMLRQLQGLIAQIRQNAQDEQVRLETLVEARTQELASRNGDMRRVLENVGQGFLTLDLDGRMSRERSAVLQTWFGPAPESGLMVDYLRQVDPSVAQWFNVCWQSVLDGMLPLTVALGQLPSRLRRDGKHFEGDYRPLFNADGQLERVLVVLSDVTAEVERARAETDEREATLLFKRLLADRPGFLEFFSEACTLVDAIRGEHTELATRKRALHTLKGNALLYGLESVARLAHSLEDRLAEQQQLSVNDLTPLLTRWSEVSGKIRELVGHERHSLDVNDADYWKVFAAIEREVPHTKLRDMLLAWRLEPTQVRLGRVAEQAVALATRLGKGPISVQVEANEIRLAPERWSPFWTTVVHVVRNSIDHGLEYPDERSSSGKREHGRIVLRTYVHGDTFTIELADDGRGIDWEAVRQKAVAAGAPSQSSADLVNALCLDGLSTKESVTELSGRGVGLGAVRRACQELGGKMEIDSARGEGTTFRFIWPAKLLAVPVPRIDISNPPPSGSLGLDRAG